MAVRVVACAALFVAPWKSTAADLTVPQALQRAEQASPELKAALDREQQARETVDILQSFYYPTLNFEAIESFGFPGSSGALGIGGLVGSPYRSGPAAGLVANLNLFDWNRHYNVRAGRQELKAVQEQTSVLRFQLDQEALQIFFEAARFRGQEEAAQAAVTAITDVAREVERFVRTGQRSVVERLLVQDQTTDAQMAAAAYHESYLVALQRLANVIGFSAQALSCPLPASIAEADLGFHTSAGPSPLLTRAAAEAAVAHIEVSAASARNWPTLGATASVGDMDQARLVEKKEYAGGFGLVFPIFEGGRISKEIHRAQSLASEKENDVLSARMALDDINARYDEIINASRVKLDYLGREDDVARRALRLAKDRYASFSGTMVDVREALRNFERIEEELNDVKTDLLLAVGSKALVNGNRT